MNCPDTIRSTRSPIIAAAPLTFPWPTIDPFIVGTFHHEEYPAGNGALGVNPDMLAGRQIGSDFSGKDGWNMYHGTSVPGFPAHPHRGFETITIVPAGIVDHADSAGAAARYGNGDVQWMTAGRGVQHGEMFPLLNTDRGNTLKMFQLWLNLPARNKLVEPEFAIFWAEALPRAWSTNSAGGRSMVEVIAGDYAPLHATDDGQPLYRAPTPPKNSWASDPASELAIWRIMLEPGTRLTLPAASDIEVRRILYIYEGDGLILAGERYGQMAVQVDGTFDMPLRNDGDRAIGILMLQARAIGEPVATGGPFVMNTHAELDESFAEFRRTQFGSWHWDTRAVTHGSRSRFARHADGVEEIPATGG
jgi:redox-sensitive bicupin YhaK (pirin superfamily)